MSDFSKNALLKKINVDIQSFIKFNNLNFSSGIEYLSKNASISTRTVERILAGDVVPQKKTLKKIYFLITKAKTEKELIHLLPDIIHKRIYGDRLESENNYFSAIDVKRKFIHDSNFRKIYTRILFGPVYPQEIKFRFGTNGLDVVKLMTDKGITKSNSDGAIVLLNRIVMDEEFFKSFFLDFWENHFYPEKCKVLGENHFSYCLGKLSLEGYDKLLRLDYECRQKKLAVIEDKKYAGNIPAWSISAVDTITNDRLYFEDWIDIDKNARSFIC